MNNQFLKESVLAAAEAGADVSTILSLLEKYAAEHGIDVDAPAQIAALVDGHQYHAHLHWVQALHTGFKHHGRVMVERGFQGMPFVEYANSKHATFGMSVFVIDAVNPPDDDDPDASNIDECLDLTTDRDNKHIHWQGWVKGHESLDQGVNAWMVDEDDQGNLHFQLDCVY